jgi:hypothetical protein
MQPQDNKAQQYICQKLTVQQIGLEVKLILQRPAYSVKTRDGDDKDFRLKVILGAWMRF